MTVAPVFTNKNRKVYCVESVNLDDTPDRNNYVFEEDKGAYLFSLKTKKIYPVKNAVKTMLKKRRDDKNSFENTFHFDRLYLNI